VNLSSVFFNNNDNINLFIKKYFSFYTAPELIKFDDHQLECY
jgi:hypothetical protein